MEMTKNFNAEDVEAGWKIFRGIWVLVPLGSAAVFMGFAIWAWFVRLDLPLMIFIGALIFFLPTLFVMIFVNDRPRTYVSDLSKLYIFKIRSVLYMRGFLDLPPYLWIKRETPDYPR